MRNRLAVALAFPFLLTIAALACGETAPAAIATATTAAPTATSTAPPTPTVTAIPRATATPSISPTPTPRVIPTRSVDLPDDTSPGSLYGLAGFRYEEGRYDEAAELYRLAAEGYGAIGETARQIESLHLHANPLAENNGLAAGVEAYEQFIQLSKESANLTYLYLGLRDLGSYYLLVGDVDSAEQYSTGLINLLSEVPEIDGDPAEVVEVYLRLANRIDIDFDPEFMSEAAMLYYNAAFDEYGKAGDLIGQGNTLYSMGDLAAYLDDIEGRRTYWLQALDKFKEAGHLGTPVQFIKSILRIRD